MRFKNRPSFKELDTKLAQGKEAVMAGRSNFGPNPGKLVDEFIGLKVGDSNEIWPLLLELLSEISPENYAGPHPPMKAIDVNIPNCELFIFVWKSKKMGKEMYIKFAVHGGIFFYISLHTSNKEKKSWKFVPNFSMPAKRQR